MAYKWVDEIKLNAALTASADAIREKTGDTAQINFDMENETGFESAIEEIESGGMELAFESDFTIDDTINENGNVVTITIAKDLSKYLNRHEILFVEIEAKEILDKSVSYQLYSCELAGYYDPNNPPTHFYVYKDVQLVRWWNASNLKYIERYWSNYGMRVTDISSGPPYNMTINQRGTSPNYPIPAKGTYTVRLYATGRFQNGGTE